MTNIKKAALGLRIRPAQVADLKFLNSQNTDYSAQLKNSKILEMNNITIKKNSDYNTLPF